MSITNNAGKMTVTNKAGASVTRNTDKQYAAAIVGYKGGKLVIGFASQDERKAKEMFAATATAVAGSVVACKFAGMTDLELVVAEEQDDCDGSAWLPVADPDAWKASDAALIVKAK